MSHRKNIKQTLTNWNYRSFKKVVHPGTSECCPYTNPDCSNSGRSQNISKYFNVSTFIIDYFLNNPVYLCYFYIIGKNQV